jgi:hypothetical protein
MMTNKLVLKVVNTVQLVAFILIPSIMFAPPIPPNPGSSTPVTPIDGGIVFLLVAGAAFGIKKIMDLKKAQTA